MGRKLAAAAFCGLLAASAQSCKTDGSNVEATNQFAGKTVGYWYEFMSFKDGDPFNFVDYHRNNKDLLLGNAAGELLPETLKGAWFMDGTVLSDRTIEFTRIYPSKVGANFMLKIYDPVVFTWSDLPVSHKMNQMFDQFSFEYEVEFLDCPTDVKAERELKWGMKDGGCSKADQQFATITPYVTVAGLRTAISHGVAYFDFYLRPKVPGQDFLVWERRTKLFRFVDEIVATISRATEKKEWTRYQFTQILDKDAKVLQSYPHFIERSKEFATQNHLNFDTMMWFRCFEGTVGCSRHHLESGTPSDKATGSYDPLNYAAMPIF